jgi:hypothetical protein
MKRLIIGFLAAVGVFVAGIGVASADNATTPSQHAAHCNHLFYKNNCVVLTQADNGKDIWGIKSNYVVAALLPNTYTTPTVTDQSPAGILTSASFSSRSQSEYQNYVYKAYQAQGSGIVTWSATNSSGSTWHVTVHIAQAPDSTAVSSTGNTRSVSNGQSITVHVGDIIKTQFPEASTNVVAFNGLYLQPIQATNYQFKAIAPGRTHVALANEGSCASTSSGCSAVTQGALEFTVQVVGNNTTAD